MSKKDTLLHLLSDAHLQSSRGPTDHFKCSVVKKWIKTKQKLEEPGYSMHETEEETFDLGPRDEQEFFIF